MGVRSGFKKDFVHTMGSDTETDSENTKATKNLINILQNFASEIPSLPGTPVQDEQLVSLDQDNIVSVQKHQIKEEPTTEPQTVSTPAASSTPAQDDTQPDPAPAASPPSAPEAEQADNDEITADFTGSITMSERGFRINVSGDRCVVM